MTDDLLKEEDRRLLMFSVSSDGDLRGWAFNPENVRRNCIYSKLNLRASSSYSSLAGPMHMGCSAFVFGLGSIVVFVCSFFSQLNPLCLPRAARSASPYRAGTREQVKKRRYRVSSRVPLARDISRYLPGSSCSRGR